MTYIVIQGMGSTFSAACKDVEQKVNKIFKEHDVAPIGGIQLVCYPNGFCYAAQTLIRKDS